LDEFFSCIEGSASIGRWEPADRIKIATLRLTGAAKLFYNGCPELHAADVTWDQFKGCRLKHQSCFSLQPGHYSSLTAPNLQYTANQERYDQCGNQHHSRELLMMGTVMPETC